MRAEQTEFPLKIRCSREQRMQGVKIVYNFVGEIPEITE